MIHTEQLARAFAVELRKSITVAQWDEMRRRNVHNIGTGVCASHDFCDANMVMDAAFARVMGREALEEDDDNILMSNWTLLIWNAAWNIAMRRYLTLPTTFEMWLETREEVPELLESGPAGAGGFEYEQGWIAAELDGTFWTIVGSEECRSADLGVVERFLWDHWANGEINGEVSA